MKWAKVSFVGFPTANLAVHLELAVSLFQRAVWVEAKLPRPFPFSPNAHRWRTAALAVDT